MKGRERTCFDYYWNELAADRSHSIPEADRAAYTAAYARPEMEENPQKTMARWQTSSDRPEDLSPGCPAEGAGV